MWRKPFGFGILKIVGEYISERREYDKSGEKGELETPKHNDRDMLSCFMEIVSTNDSVPPW